jgi:hypothetical protein
MVHTPIILTDVFYGFPQSLQTNAGIVPQIRQWLLPSSSFPNYYSLIILHFNVILTTSLNNAQIISPYLVSSHSVCLISSLTYSTYIYLIRIFLSIYISSTQNEILFSTLHWYFIPVIALVKPPFCMEKFQFFNLLQADIKLFFT